MFICHLYIFITEVYVQIFCLFFIVCPIIVLCSYYWVLRFLCIFWIHILCLVCVLQIVSQATATLIFLIVYLTEQNILILMKSNFLIFYFMECAFDVFKKWSLPWLVWLTQLCIHMARLVGHCPVHWKVACLIPNQGACPGCRLHPW